MNGFITNFNQDLGNGVAATRKKLETLKKASDAQTDRAQTALSGYLEELDKKIHDQSEKLEAMDDDFEDWAFHKFEEIDERKDERTHKKLLKRAVQAQSRSDNAFSNALHAIDRAEREMLRSKIAHADAGLPKPEPKIFANLDNLNQSVGTD